MKNYRHMLHAVDFAYKRVGYSSFAADASQSLSSVFVTQAMLEKQRATRLADHWKTQPKTGIGSMNAADMNRLKIVLNESDINAAAVPQTVDGAVAAKPLKPTKPPKSSAAVPSVSPATAAACTTSAPATALAVKAAYSYPYSSVDFATCHVCSLDPKWPFIMRTSDGARPAVTHHCGACGAVCCAVCSPAGDKLPGDGVNQYVYLDDCSLSLPYTGDYRPQRVCLRCYFDFSLLPNV